MSKIMLPFHLYYRRFGIRLPGQLLNPRIFDVNHLTIPRGTFLHYLPVTQTELGPASDELILRNVTRLTYITHVIRLTSLKGNPRSSMVMPGPMVQEYRRRQRKIRPMNKLDVADREEQNLLIANYALLPRLYKYIRSYFTQYYTWYNIRSTLWDTVNQYLKETTRHQFIQITLPEQIPALNQLRRAENTQTKETLEPFRSDAGFDLLDLWMWLGKDRSKSIMSKVEKKNLERVNLIFHHLGKWMVINLGTLDGWRADPDVKGSSGAEAPTFQLRFLKMLTRFFEMATLNVGGGEPPAGTMKDPVEHAISEKEVEEKTSDDDEDVKKQLDDIAKPVDQETQDELNEMEDVQQQEEDVEYDEDGNVISSNKKQVELLAPADITYQKQRSHETAILAKADQLADAGMITGAEYRRLQRISGAYKNIKNPYTGEGSLEEAMVITEEDVMVSKEPTVPDLPQILDKSLLSSTVEQVNAQYIEKVLPKDILNSVMMVQQAGIAVTGYNVDRVTDAVSDYEIHSVTLTPAVGKQSTIRFRVPKVRPNGTYTSNNVQYRMRAQRADVPIRKVSPDRVGISSYYSKIFVDRSDRSVFNYGRWLTNMLVAKGLDPSDETVTDLRVSTVDDVSSKLPYVYSMISTRIVAFKADGYQYWFDYRNRVKQGPFEEEDTKHETKGMVLVAKKGDTLVLVDKNDVFYTTRGDGHFEVYGRAEDLFDLPSEKAPPQMAELKLFSKSIPIGVVLGYLIGFDTLLKTLKVTPRIVPNGERLNLMSDEFAVRFLDETYIFSKDDNQVAMVFAGFNLYKNTLRNYSAHTFNKKDVYYNILEQNGMGVRYLREIDLMDAMFVDPITKEILEWMKEPTEFVPLLLRAVEMLSTRYVPEKVEGAKGVVEGLERARGYERIAGAVYSELVKSIRVYNARTATSSASISMNPHAVWTTIVQDPSASPIEQANPIHNLKEKEVVTFGGTGGRSRRSMTAETRLYKESDRGFISEGTVDSGDVAIITYMSPNANFTTVRGTVRHFDKKQDGSSTQLSTAALLAPAADRDDPKRVLTSALVP